jgi:hypothetical protein
VSVAAGGKSRRDSKSNVYPLRKTISSDMMKEQEGRNCVILFRSSAGSKRYQNSVVILCKADCLPFSVSHSGSTSSFFTLGRK